MKTYYLVNRKGDLGRFNAILRADDYNQYVETLGVDWATENPVISNATPLKGRFVSKFNGRSVRRFSANGGTYEVFTDGSARLAVQTRQDAQREATNG